MGVRVNRIADFEVGEESATQPDRPNVPGNSGPLFEVGADAYWHYRKRAFRAPPTPSKPGAALYVAVAEIAVFMSRKGVPLRQAEAEFNAHMDKIRRLCTLCIRPLTLGGMVLRAVGLWNPLRDASDGELKELADFLLQRRAKSSIRFN